MRHSSRGLIIVRRFIVAVFLLAFGQCTFAKSDLPVIKASSRFVDIRDGLHFKKKYWYILPERIPDYYYTEIPRKEHRVTFITDLDSISFDVKYGREYDFIILLNNKDSCYTRIAAKEKNLVTFKSSRSFSTVDTIPFTISDNSKIYFKGRINNSEPLDIQFDLGAGGCLIKKSSVEKVNMNFDGSITLINSDGTNVVPSSSSNTLNIANLTWDSISFAVADNMTHREDLIVGNSLFQNKVIEINYDEHKMVIRDNLSSIDSGYSRHDIVLDGGTVPFLQGSVVNNSTTKTGWFIFDTGAYTTILSDRDISMTNKMFVEAERMVGASGEALMPRLIIGGYAFSDFNYTTQNLGREDIVGILGNDLLKRFNVILDNTNGYMYLKPNLLVHEPYANPEYYFVRVTSVVLVALITAAAFIVYRTWKK